MWSVQYEVKQKWKQFKCLKEEVDFSCQGRSNVGSEDVETKVFRMFDIGVALSDQTRSYNDDEIVAEQ